MKIIKNKKILKIILILGVLAFIFGSYWVFYLEKAHKTYENYYAFRGCIQEIKKTKDYGICKTGTGETIKIVKFQGKWYLDGDLPCGFLCF